MEKSNEKKIRDTQECYNNDNTLVSVAEYRKLLNDNKSSDDQIVKRLNYLEAFCRNIIRSDLESCRNKKNE